MVARSGLWLCLSLAARVHGTCAPPANDSARHCGATQDVILVVDNSYSLADRHSAITEFMLTFVNNFELDTTNTLTPRIGLVTFSGCDTCTEGQSAQALYPPTADAAILGTVITGRPPPQADMPMTCISCGLNVARSLLTAFAREESMPLVFVLTDGEQSILGGDEEAVWSAGQLKDEGVDIVALS